MDKHKALIERLTCEIVDAAQDNGSEIGGAFARKLATAALNAVYEALKEPSDEMKEAGAFWYEYIKADVDFPYQVGTWQAMLSASALSSSPLGKGE